MRVAIALLLGLLMGACDRELAQEPQDGRTAAATAGGAQATSRIDRASAGEAAPATVFRDPDGEPATLTDFRGKPLLVNLWATWCAPCVAEMPTLDALAAREKDLQVLAVSQDMDGRAKVHPFFAERGLSQLEPYLDEELGLMGALKVDTLPTTILFDADGREVWRATGKEDWTGSRAARLLAEAGA